MNKDSKTVKTEKGFFEWIITPIVAIVAGIMIIFAVLDKASDFIGKYLCILMIIISILFIIASIVFKTYDGIIVGIFFLIPSAPAYIHYYRKRKKN